MRYLGLAPRNLLVVLVLAMALAAGPVCAQPQADSEQPAPAEKTAKETDVGRTALLLPSKLVQAPLNLFEGGLKETLDFIEGKRLVDKLQYYVRYLNDRGVYPSAYSLGDGSGVGAGVRVRRSPTGVGCLGLAAGVTTKLYQSYQAQAALPLCGGRLALSTRAGWQYRPEEEFYGIGPETTTATRSDYLLKDGFFEGATRLGCPRLLQAAVAVRYDIFQTSPGQDSGVRSIQDVFTPAEVPGLLQSINLVSGGFTILHDSRDWPEVPTTGGFQQLTANIFHDPSDDRFDFYRARLDLEQLLPFSSLKHAFLVRAFAEVNQPVSDSDQVPFFMLAKLGGSYWLRGFHELRYYDERAVTWSLEYRYRIWSRADAFLYVDQGEVFGSKKDFSAGDIATSGGGGFMIRNFGFRHSEDIVSGGPAYVAAQEHLFFKLLIGATGEGIRPFVIFGTFI
ncbi:MAG: BamA/TamA family outer membrane protein [Pseudomonadota bacterium]